MGLDVYFRRDIANVLRGTACASEGAVCLAGEMITDPRLLQAYRQGVRNALLSVGLAFGLEPTSAAPELLSDVVWTEVPRIA